MTYLARAAQSLKWAYRYFRARHTHPLYSKLVKENLGDAWEYLQMSVTRRRTK